MKKLIILRGIQGSGKSSFVKDNGLELHTLSSDKIRIMSSGYVLNEIGNPIINNQDNDFIWSTLFLMLENRMKNDLLTIVDATHYQLKSLNKYIELAKKYNYELCLIDFDISLEEAYKRNEIRPIEQKVPDNVILKFYNTIQETRKQKNKNIRQLSRLNWKQELVNEYIVDVSKYNNIYVVSDLQGTFLPLKKFFEENPMNDNDLYIFVGDYVDRGIENHLSVTFCLNNYKRKNVIFLEGNHEFHLKSWATNQEIKSNEFIEGTKPQLEQANISKLDVIDFCNKLKEFVVFRKNDKDFIVSHCGVNHFPSSDELLFWSSREFSYKKYYKSPVDSIFEQNTQKNQYQIHGHRNPEQKTPNITDRSFALENNVEYGGYLWICQINEEGISFMNYKNTLSKNSLPLELIKDLSTNKFVKEKALSNGIFSYNFTREAFYDKEWNDLTTKARGLFIHKETGIIVARSFEKFFNINEFNHCSLQSLEQMTYPVSVYLKDNGFLGILGYNHVIDELMFCSKSTDDKEFANYFKQMFIKKYGNQLENVKKFLRDKKVSMVFEVVDMENDPHIIEYAQSELILLDVIYNTMEFNHLLYDNLVAVSKQFKMQVKQRVKELKDYKELTEFYNESTQENYKYNNSYIEGFVLEDSNRKMVKIKCHYYNFWKKIRGYCMRISKAKPGQKIIAQLESEQTVLNFVLQNQLFNNNVIEIARLYYKQLKNDN